MAKLSKLDAEIRRLQKNANGKVSRLEAANVAVRFSEFDVREPLSQVDSMTYSQKRSYANRLRRFNSRQNAFVAGAERSPIPKALWDRYKASEAKFNAKVAREMDRLSPITLHGQARTVGERDADVLPKSERLRSASARRPLTPITRDLPGNIMGARGVRILMEDLERRTTRKHTTGRIKAQKLEALDIADRLGDAGLKKKLMKMSLERFNVLWNYTAFSEDMGQAYETADTAGDAGRQHLSDNGHIEDLHSQVEWATALEVPKTGNAKRKGSARAPRRVR